MTGLIGVGFVIGHMIGNLQVFDVLGGREKLNAYAHFLRSTGGLLWAVRFTLLTATVLHIVAAWQLRNIGLDGRPIDYACWKPVASTYASRTMRWSGPILGLFIAYHILHLTVGSAHPNFNAEGDVYANVVTGFQVWYVSAVYIVAMIALGFHLYHGVWSMFQSLGLNSSKYTSMFRIVSVVASVVLVLGNISIPIAVLTGIVG